MRITLPFLLILMLFVSLLGETFHGFNFEFLNSSSEEELIVVEDYSHGHVHYHYFTKSEISNSVLPIEQGESHENPIREVAENHIHVFVMYVESNYELPVDHFTLNRLKLITFEGGKPSSYKKSPFRPPIA